MVKVNEMKMNLGSDQRKSVGVISHSQRGVQLLSTGRARHRNRQGSRFNAQCAALSGASDTSLPQPFCITHSINLHLHVNARAEGANSPTEETRSDCRMLCYKTGDVLLMSRQQISVFGGEEVACTQRLRSKSPAVWSR